VSISGAELRLLRGGGIVWHVVRPGRRGHHIASSASWT
jgi:hypothetical protein